MRDKEEAIFQTFKKVEEERRRIDEEEADLKQREREKIIKEANKKLFETNQSVKLFKSKMLLSDMKEENEVHLQMKEIKKETDKLYGQYHDSYLAEQQKAFDERLEQERQRRAQLQKQANEILKK